MQQKKKEMEESLRMSLLKDERFPGPFTSDAIMNECNRKKKEMEESFRMKLLKDE